MLLNTRAVGFDIQLRAKQPIVNNTILPKSS